MKATNLGKGDKSTIGGEESIESLGLISREAVDNKRKLREETNEMTQRPVSKTESVKSDRGTFTSKC